MKKTLIKIINELLEKKKEKKIIRENINKMNNEMLYFLTSESIGGNAGFYEEYPCVAANFYFDENGRILEFTNNIKNLYRGTFHLVIFPNKYKILNVYHELNSLDKELNLPQPPKKAISLLQKCVEIYNDRQNS